MLFTNITCAFIEKDGIIKGGFFRNICNNATYMLFESSCKLIAGIIIHVQGL